MIKRNALINESKEIRGEQIYVLRADDWGEYLPCEHAWHNAEIKLIFRELNTIEFIEFVGYLIDEELLSCEEINELLEKEGASFRFEQENEKTIVCVFTLEELEEKEQEGQHPNIRLLVNRMEASFENSDFGGVLHASATIFETMAKDIIGISSIQNQTLKSFFDRYRRDSLLPNELLDYILQIYENRNITPLAGHGSTQVPNILKEQAVVLCEITKAFVRTEYRLLKESKNSPNNSNS
jgi:hypothetical protein